MSKVCTSCKVLKAFDEFPKAPRMNDGRASHCRKCRNEEKKRWSLSERGAKMVEAYAKNYYQENKEREREQGLQYYRENREKVLPKMRDRAAKKYKEDDIYRSKHKAHSVNWRRNNRAADNALSREKQMRKRRAMPSWLSAIQKAQIREFYELALASSVQTGIKHHVDHIFALKGKEWRGLHVPWNLRVMTGRENNQKLNKPPKELMHLFWSAA